MRLDGRRLIVDPDEVARRTAEAMQRADAAGREAGVRLLDVGPGRALVGLTVQPRHVNGHGICHGGYLFLLADAAFAYACNSHGVSAVAAGADITFLRPVPLGAELVAEAVERALRRPVRPLRRHGAGGAGGGGRVPRPHPAGPGLPAADLSLRAVRAVGGEEGRAGVRVGLVVVAVEDRGQAARDRRHDPAPVGRAAPAGVLLAGHVLRNRSDSEWWSAIVTPADVEGVLHRAHHLDQRAVPPHGAVGAWCPGRGRAAITGSRS